MIPISAFLDKLDCLSEQLAGHNHIDSLAADVVLLNHQDQIWLTRQKTDEFEDALVFVESRMFPGYLSTFDLLLRFLKQAGAAGVLFQGGKRSDFSKATVMLAENLGLPLIWIAEPVKYSAMARQFYSLLLTQLQQRKAEVARARRTLEASLCDMFTLHTWLTHVAQVLDSTVKLRLSDAAVFDAGWRSHKRIGVSYRGSHSYDGNLREDTLVVPIRILEKRYELCITPSPTCGLYEPDIQQVWVDELAGLLVAQVSYLLLLETPGIATEHEWVTSFESLVYFALSNMPIFKLQNGVSGGETLTGDVLFPDIASSISLRRHLELISPSPATSISVLWIAPARESGLQSSGNYRELDIDVSVSSPVRPYAYRLFRDDTLLLRHNALDLLRHARFSTGMQYDLLSSVPWRNWKSKEGIAVVWVPFAKTAAYPSERVVRDFVSQLSARIPFSLRAYFHRTDLSESAIGTEEVLRQVVNVFDTSYPEFLSQQDGAQSLQFSQTGRDMANVILQGTSLEASYQHALGLLQPILSDKSRASLLEALEAYLECGGKTQVAADRLHLHRNSMRYRLNRLEELLGVSLADADVRFTYQVAVRTWRLNHGNAETPSTF
jgi:hypothetical protein